MSRPPDHPPGYENCVEETYSVYVECKNCGRRVVVEIPKGKRIKDFPCPNCGCFELRKG